MMTMHCHVVGLKCSRGHVRVHRQKLEQQKEIARRRMWRQEYCKDLYYERHLSTNEAIQCRLRLMFWSRRRGQHGWWRTYHGPFTYHVSSRGSNSQLPLCLWCTTEQTAAARAAAEQPPLWTLHYGGRRYLKIFQPQTVAFFASWQTCTHSLGLLHYMMKQFAENLAGEVRFRVLREGGGKIWSSTTEQHVRVGPATRPGPKPLNHTSDSTLQEHRLSVTSHQVVTLS